VLRDRRDMLVEELNKVPGFSAHKPESTFYVFVNVTKAMEVLQIRSLEEFRKQLLRETGVSFCTREHFGEALAFENQYYVRFAYSGIDKDMIVEGIRNLADYIRSKQA
jgi:aspartate aminotransferase